MTTDGTTGERELTEQAALCLPDGRLNRAAVGWSRTPLLDTSGIGGRHGWGRNKRWEYWAVTSPTHLLAVTVSSLDYSGVHSVMVHDRMTGETIEHGTVAPPWTRPELPASLGDGPARATASGLQIELSETVDGTRLRARTDEVSFDVLAALPAGHERLAVVVPWSVRRFQYTVKDVGRPASGTVTVRGTRVKLAADDTWAVLDHGRGRWPYRIRWNWGAASGTQDGRAVGIQLGGRWTDGTGSTENATVLDGRLHKIHESLRWTYDQTDWLRPWHIHGGGVDLVFEPFWDHATRTELGVVGSRGHQCFGHYSGTIPTDDGPLSVDGLLGWAEDVRNRW
ncbi:DUF2804 domain-containing protein [Leifsonia sp. 21MFCrub1.1]|uniref:DUF2804 domain-containing protein n=1 Tax=Leifsonia sp. 21MFCrub1.1 TaxID=1798223 RepID=UPI000892A2EC|nr:DUF2804 domain-containing protein [Leifsonia sp. 21MFCrub1.1]SEB07898.1 Protein of unknown function [Leifsonia sp. 21MFCrub1.1]